MAPSVGSNSCEEFKIVIWRVEEVCSEVGDQLVSVERTRFNSNELRERVCAPSFEF